MLKTEKNRISSVRTETLTRKIIQALESCDYRQIEREKKIVEGDISCFKDIFAYDDEDDATYGFEVKTHRGDITNSIWGKECCSCNYNYFVVWPDCYYYIEKYLKENNYDHVGIIVGCQNWLDFVKEPKRIKDCWGKD